nr:MAG TPA: hypothetical protein [Caudoviricetes sp.]
MLSLVVMPLNSITMDFTLFFSIILSTSVCV